jgi:hypothetical protein
LFPFDPNYYPRLSELLNIPIQTMPAIHAGLRETWLRKRDADDFITAAFLGLNGLKKAITLFSKSCDSC